MTDDPNRSSSSMRSALPEPIPLVELFPACFDEKERRPLKIGIHRDLVAAGYDKLSIRRSLGFYCRNWRYQKALKAGILRVDLQGRPAGLVTMAEAEHARACLKGQASKKASGPSQRTRPNDPKKLPDDSPLPKENLVSGRLELTVKFSDLPKPMTVQGGIKIGIETAEGVVTAILSPKIWRKLEQAAKDYPMWVAALSGSLDRVIDKEIVLKQPAVQVFEKKSKPTADAIPASNGSATNASPVANPASTESKASANPVVPPIATQTPNAARPTLSLKDRAKKPI